MSSFQLTLFINLWKIRIRFSYVSWWVLGLNRLMQHQEQQQHVLKIFNQDTKNFKKLLSCRNGVESVGKNPKNFRSEYCFHKVTGITRNQSFPGLTVRPGKRCVFYNNIFQLFTLKCVKSYKSIEKRSSLYFTHQKISFLLWSLFNLILFRLMQTHLYRQIQNKSIIL
jgi:hypothetical protein